MQKSNTEKSNLDLIWLETPSNPLLQVVDIEQIALQAKSMQFFGSGRQHILIPSFAEST